jgi:two-component system, cell cycle sensor histidine kinase and response regulator CckA
MEDHLAVIRKPTYEDLKQRIKVLEKESIKGKRAEEALSEVKFRYSALVEGALDGIVVLQDGLIQFINPFVTRSSGYKKEELIGKSFFDLIHADDLEIVIQRFADRMACKVDEQLTTFRLRFKNGDFRHIETMGSVIRYEGKPAMSIFMRDITERKQSEMELLREKLFTEKLLESLPGIFFFYDSTCHLKRWNKAHETATGFSADELRDWYIPDWHETPEDAAMGMALVKSVLETGVGGAFETTLINKEGRFVPYLISITRLLTPDGPAMMGVGIDITDRKQAEEALKESENKYRLLADNVNDVIFVLDMNFDITYVSPSIKILMGYDPEELLKQPAKETMTPSSWDLAMKSISEVIEPKRFEHRKIPTSRTAQLEMRRKDGTTIWVEVKASFIRDENQRIVGILGVTRDISERKRTEEARRTLEERLQRAEKMEALGQLAGGVAHDLNNVLGVLTGYSELLLMEIPEGHQRARSHVEKIMQSTEKGAVIIQDLLTLARRGVMAPEVVNLNDVVSGFFKTPVFEKMKDFHPRVNFRIEFDENLLNIKGSPVHLEKTLMNLVSNAAESISGNGEVKICTESRYLDKAIRGYDDVKEGDYAVLTVSDTGIGITAGDREKIFEPFYTKKKMGSSGTGLGLAIVWGTVKDHNGYIDIKTEVGKGSIFTLYFPVTREELTVQQQKVPIERYMGNGESVLVVDDVAEQQQVAAVMLTKLGYQVYTVAGGKEAVEYLKGNKADVLVLDMIMEPGIDGLETYKRVREINPGQKAIIVSGFSETDRVKEAQTLGAGTYVKKPYVMEKIGLAIRKELDRK